MRSENVIYTIQNEHGDEGFIQYIDLDDGLEYHEVTEGADPYLPEYAHCYNVISKKQHDDILELHREWAEHEKDETWDKLRALIVLTVKNSKLFQLSGSPL